MVAYCFIKHQQADDATCWHASIQKTSYKGTYSGMWVIQFHILLWEQIVRHSLVHWWNYTYCHTPSVHSKFWHKTWFMDWFHCDKLSRKILWIWDASWTDNVGWQSPCRIILYEWQDALEEEKRRRKRWRLDLCIRWRLYNTFLYFFFFEP